MPEIPDHSNFFSSLDTRLSRKQIADLYKSLGWQVRKCSWVDYEVRSEWAELVIKSESPILVHGPVADLLTHAEELVAPLRAAEISFTAECYGSDPDDKFILELTS